MAEPAKVGSPSSVAELAEVHHAPAGPDLLFGLQCHSIDFAAASYPPNLTLLADIFRLIFAGIINIKVNLIYIFE